jgi:6-phosphogluconolactonase
MHFYRYADPRGAAEACARQILTRLEEAASGHRDPSLAVSGGSTPKLLFDVLAKSGFDWKHVHLFWVDERMVPPTDAESNYRLAEEHFLKPAHFPHRNVHRIHGELRPDAAAANYVRDIEEFFNLQEGELPRFDIVHLGMGADAHTASLFPGEPLLEDRAGIASSVYVEKLARWRVTLLPGTIVAARHVLFLVAGADKAEPLRHVLESPYQPLQYPAQVVAHHSRHITWLVDEAAGALTTT